MSHFCDNHDDGFCDAERAEQFKKDGAMFNQWWDEGHAMLKSDGSWRGIALDAWQRAIEYERRRVWDEEKTRR